MGREKGCEKRGGRQKGTPNKNAAIVRTFCDYIVDSGFEKFKHEFDKLDGKQYIEVFLRLAAITTNEKINVTANNKLIEMFNQKLKQNGTNK